MKKINSIFYNVLFLFFLLLQKVSAHAFIEVQCQGTCFSSTTAARQSTGFRIIGGLGETNEHGQKTNPKGGCLLGAPATVIKLTATTGTNWEPYCTEAECLKKCPNSSNRLKAFCPQPASATYISNLICQIRKRPDVSSAPAGAVPAPSVARPPTPASPTTTPPATRIQTPASTVSSLTAPRTPIADELQTAKRTIKRKLEETIKDINTDKARYFGHDRGGNLVLDLVSFDRFLGSVNFNDPASLRSEEFQFDFKNPADEAKCVGQLLCLRVIIWPKKERKNIETAGGFKTVKTNVLIFYITPTLTDTAPTRFVEATSKSPYLTNRAHPPLEEIFNPDEWSKITKVPKKAEATSDRILGDLGRSIDSDSADEREVYIAPYKGIPAYKYGMRYAAASYGLTPISESDLEQVSKTLVEAAIRTDFKIYDIKPDNILLLYGATGTPPTVTIIDYTTKVFTRAYLSVPERRSPMHHALLTPEFVMHYTVSAIISTIHELDDANTPMTTRIIDRLLTYATTVPAETGSTLYSRFITHFDEKIRDFKSVPTNFVWDPPKF